MENRNFYPEPSEQNGFLFEHIELLLRSFHQLIGRPLLHSPCKGKGSERSEGIDAAREVFFGKFALVSHNTASDPVFNYANQTALTLFESSWHDFTSLHSRFSAEQENRRDRVRLLEEVTKKGFIENYSGVRISSTGRRFQVTNATVWNLTDKSGIYAGQAAFIERWDFL